MSLNLQGWLPGEDADGLSRLDGPLIERFEAAYAAGKEDAEPVQAVVIGVVEVQSVKHRKAGGPVVSVRFVKVEAVDGPEADQVQAMIGRLHDRRVNIEALPYPEGDDEPDRNNVGGPVTNAGAPQLPDPTNVVDPGPPGSRTRGRKRPAKNAGEVTELRPGITPEFTVPGEDEEGPAQ